MENEYLHFGHFLSLRFLSKSHEKVTTKQTMHGLSNVRPILGESDQEVIVRWQ